MDQNRAPEKRAKGKWEAGWHLAIDRQHNRDET